MIIVSQKKETIVNFDNIVKIWLEKPLDDDKDTEIIVESDDIMETIGYYKTEERAKEVLKEIAEYYSKFYEVQGEWAVYQMPKE